VGIVISLDQHRAQRAEVAARPPRVDCFFDLADPASYLAFERVERLSATIAWRPAVLPGGGRRWTPAHVEARAWELRLPLMWPDREGAFARAMRVAAYACEQGRAAPFVLAASRLAFCGGFDLDDPLVLAEAIAAAGLGLEAAWAAAADPERDVAMHTAGRFLAAQGATELPVLQAGRALFAGEARIAEAAAALRGARAASSRMA
jgi:2-hydroxychromene-2-carboxylate isomerase